MLTARRWVAIFRRTGPLAVAVATAVACGCSSGAGGGSGGAGAGTGGAGAGTGGSSVGNDGGGTGGAAGTGGIVGGSGSGGVGADAMGCDPKTSFTLAVHVALSVGWPDTVGGNAGTGTINLWNLVKMTIDGTKLTSVTQPCGSTLPELTLKPIIGGGNTLLDVPDSVWDAPAVPKVASMGTISGWTVGSALSTDTTNVLVGLTMPDPNGAWPDSHAMVTAVDTDGDGLPGITTVPRTGAGFVQPPVSLPILGLGAKADKVYLASRTAVALSGTLTSCMEQAGTATVKFFDSHVVGCHVSGGSECTTAQVDFIDMNRTPFTMSGGTFKSKMVPDAATCADARMAIAATP